MAEIEAKEPFGDQEGIRNQTSSSDSEKARDSQGAKAEEDSEHDLPPDDPDAHLSREERAKVVRQIYHPFYQGKRLMAARWFLGLAEAGLFPGINYYLSCWYERDEFRIRAATFFSAAAIVKMNGIGSRPGWAWIFILEGLLTILLGLLSTPIIQDFPHSATFLTSLD